MGGGQSSDPQPIDYLDGLLKWTTHMSYPKRDYPKKNTISNDCFEIRITSMASSYQGC